MIATVKVPSKQRQRKERMFADFEGMCASADGVIVAEYAGIDVATLARLRQAAKAAGGQVRVVKNTVAKRVLRDNARHASLVDQLTGQLIYGAGASVSALAKVMRDFAKDHEQLRMRAGTMDGELLDQAKLAKVANLPSRDELLGILAGTLSAPITKLARTLAEVPASCARVLAAVRDARPPENQ